MPRRALVLLLAVLVAFPVLAAVASADDPPPVRPERGRHLDLEVDRYGHDFGFVKQGSTHETVFTLTNTSSKTIRGIRARGDCGCNVLDVEKKVLAPGQSCAFRVRFETHTLGGRLRKTVRIVSSEHRRGEIVIPLDIRIQAGLVQQPSAVNFREVPQGSLPTKSFWLRWYEGHGTPFRVTSVAIPGYEDTFGASLRPWKDPKDPKWQGWQIDVRMLEPLPLGNLSAEIRVRTTDEERPELTLPLQGNIVGKLWVQQRYFSFGSVTLPTEKKSSLKIKPYKPDVAITNPRAVSKLGKVLVEVIPDPYMAKQGMWKLIARIAPDAPAGSLADERITLHTGVPGEETVEFAVRGQVRRTSAQTAPAKGAGDGR